MEKLNVRHFLDIYQTRESMQDERINNPSPEIKKFTRKSVKKFRNAIR